MAILVMYTACRIYITNLGLMTTYGFKEIEVQGKSPWLHQVSARSFTATKDSLARGWVWHHAAMNLLGAENVCRNSWFRWGSGEWLGFGGWICRAGHVKTISSPV